MQISADELKTETEAVFTIVKCDSEFFKDIKEMSLQKDLIRAEKAVYEAISFLQRTTEQEIHSDKHFHISTEVNLMLFSKNECANRSSQLNLLACHTVVAFFPPLELHITLRYVRHCRCQIPLPL